MAANYGSWPMGPNMYDPYNPGAAYGYPGPYSSPYTTNRIIPNQVGPQQTQQQLPPQEIQQNSNVPWIRVPNIEAARNVMVQPNQTAYMMNQNAPEFYVKATDAMGVATLRCFKFQEYDPTQEAAKEVLSSQAGNLVSREEFNNFANAVSAQFNALQQGINVGNINAQSTQQTPAVVATIPAQTTNLPVIPEKETANEKTSTRKKETTA